LDKENDRARILKIDTKTGQTRVVATGLRNPVGMALEPQTDELWAVVNERDELGSDLVPDYLTSVKEGAFYGWPFSYWGQHIDNRVTHKDQTSWLRQSFPTTPSATMSPRSDWHSLRELCCPSDRRAAHS
jgi:glucose/arabinose dehydrogenase